VLTEQPLAVKLSADVAGLWEKRKKTKKRKKSLYLIVTVTPFRREAQGSKTDIVPSHNIVGF